jgi:hypothetical protein
MDTIDPRAAGALRQCGYTLETGERCRRAAAPGATLCAAHMPRRSAPPPIHVPLLDDRRSIRYVISEVVLALAQGRLAPAQANAMLRGCQLARELLCDDAAAEKAKGDKASKERAAEPEAASAAKKESEPPAETPHTDLAQDLSRDSRADANTAASGEEKTETPETDPPAQTNGPVHVGDLRAGWDRWMPRRMRTHVSNAARHGAPGSMGVARASGAPHLPSFGRCGIAPQARP